MNDRRNRGLAGIVCAAVLAAVAASPWAHAQDAGHRPAKQPSKNAAKDRLVQRGRYLVEVAGCNDCHTPGWNEAAGKVPVESWLTGDRLGWRGPWGTTYATNLRLYISGMSQQQWVDTARSMKPRPPMPWYNLRAMSERDLVAIYRFVAALGPAGEPAPAWLPPDREPPQPYVQFPRPPGK